MAEPMAMKDGMAVAPERPGHGVSLLWDRLEPHRIA
jgi:L-alanine-DL-glutamate epimerase-like enolase superfamily enzyme